MKRKLFLPIIILLILLSACQKQDTKVDDTCKHVWSGTYTVEEPTEEEDGARVYSCILCGEKKRTPIPMLEEGDTYFLMITDASCEEEGSKIYTSEEWGDYTVTIPPLGHLYPSEPNRSTVTCTEDGEDIYICSRCKGEDRRTRVATGHDFNVYVHEGNCLEKGYTEYECKKCGVINRANETDYVHEYEKGQYVAGSCTQKGYTPYTCKRCNAVKKEETDYEHIYNKVTGSCDICGARCSHNFDKDYVCADCGFDIREELSDRSGVFTYGELIYFGLYPQSHVSDPELIKELDEAFGTGDGEERTLYGVKYARANVKEQSNRVYLFSDGTSMSTALNGGREIHYFRFDPIAWRAGKDGVLIADCILDTGVFQNKDSYFSTGALYYCDMEKGIYANDWSVSMARNFLANDFYERAFNEKQKALIQTVENDNEGSGFYPANDDRPWFTQEATTDTVFLPSFADLYEKEDVTDEPDPTKVRKLSDYSMCSSIKIEGGDEVSASWMLRSSGLYSAQICAIDKDGVLFTDAFIYREKTIGGKNVVEKMGIVPAIKLSLSE